MDDDTIRRNVEATIARGYVPLRPLAPHRKTLTICGNGPSLKETWGEIRGTAWACNGASRFLAERKVPWVGFYWDSLPVMAEMVQRAGEAYLVASQCDPGVFETLDGEDIVVWHPFNERTAAVLVERGRGDEPLIHGGASAVTRAIFVGYALGYRSFDIHGADSSLKDGELHALNHPNDVEPKLVNVVCAGREFLTTAGFARQAQDFPRIVEFFKDCRFAVHGDGLIPHIARLMGVHAMNIQEA